MTQSTQELNKTLVLQAFDLLFNKRDSAPQKPKKV